MAGEGQEQFPDIRFSPSSTPNQSESSRAFGRGDFAKQLTDIILASKTHPHGLVISIDGQWGSGKTTFSILLRDLLNKHKAQADAQVKSPVILIDAFQSEPTGSALGCIIYGISDALELHPNIRKSFNEISDSLKRSLAFSALSLLPVAGSSIFTLAKEISNAAADTERERIANTYEQITNFKAVLEKASDLWEALPLVIIIDELDRCRPDYAVSIIEAAKHYFDVTGVTFVLLMQREQLCESIRGIYGLGIDADKYLQKFFHLELVLPSERDDIHYDDYLTITRKIYDHLHTSHGIEYLLETLGKDKRETITFYNNLLTESVAYFSDLSGMSIRDIERAFAIINMTLLALGRDLRGNRPSREGKYLSVALLGMLACIRLVDRKLFETLRSVGGPPEELTFERLDFRLSSSNCSKTHAGYNSIIWLLAASSNTDAHISKIIPEDASVREKVRTDIDQLRRFLIGEQVGSANTVIRTYCRYMSSMRAPNL